MRTLKYEQALTKLRSEAVEFGIDLTVENPVKFLMKTMAVGHGRALAILKELEVRGLISLVCQGVGGVIVKAIIKQEEVPERFYEVSEERRLINALWQLRRQSKQNPALSIVHSLVFGDVRALADIQQSRFYMALEEFEKKGWIQYYRASEHKILYLIITNKFPAP